MTANDTFWGKWEDNTPDPEPTIKKGFLIDPNYQTITEVTQSGLEDLYKLIECRTVEMVYPFNSCTDGIYVDEEGYYADPRPASFKIKGHSVHYIGKGVVVGSGANGEDTDPRLTLDMLEELVIWLDVEDTEPKIEVYSWPV